MDKPDLSYLIGNTSDLSAEWEFGFVLSKDGNKRISKEEATEFFDEILVIAEEHGFGIGGWHKPVLDADYEEMIEDANDNLKKLLSDD